MQVNRNKRFSLASEMTAIATLCHDGSTGGMTAANNLLRALNEDHFATEAGLESFKRIRRLLKRDGELPALDELLDDQGLDEDIRHTINSQLNMGVKQLKTSARAEKLVSRLDGYRKVRQLFRIGVNLEKALSESTLDPDEIIEKLTVSIKNTASSNRSMRVSTRGGDNSSLAIAKRVLNSSGAHYIPTGFHAFDSINSGFPRGAFVMMMTRTGHGKSAMLLQLAHNMAMKGARVGFVPLEMDEDELAMRDLARASGIDVSKFTAAKKKMTREERRLAYKKYKQETLKMARRGGYVKILKPGIDIGVEELLSDAKPFDFDVLIVDYVTLFKGVGGDNQWQLLGDATRYAKIWAEHNKCVVIMAAQTTEEGLLRYSRTMEEHAPYSWAWLPNGATSETQIYLIEQRKARQAKPFTFPLKFNFPKMEVSDVSQKEEIAFYEKLAQADKNKESKYGKRKEEGRSHDKWSEEDGDDDDYESEDKPQKRKPDGSKRRSNSRYGGGRGGGKATRFNHEF